VSLASVGVGFKTGERVRLKDYFDSGFPGGQCCLVIQVTDKNVVFFDTFHEQYFLPLEAKRAACHRWVPRRAPISLRYHIDRGECIMAYVITETCIKDMLCVDVCPTDCIHPTKMKQHLETPPSFILTSKAESIVAQGVFGPGDNSSRIFSTIPRRCRSLSTIT
jgi:ferredoxin